MADVNRDYRLLIVDDDETDRRLYGWLLAREAPGAFRIEQAADGAAGIAALRAREFDCVLVDFSMPDVTGLEFLAEAAVDGALPCAVILISGHGNEAVAVEAMRLGAHDYLVKEHVNEGRLWHAIERAVSLRESHERLAGSRHALITVNAALKREVAAHETTAMELRAARDAAERADQAKSQFIAMVTQELRAPVNGILGVARSLRMEEGLSARQSALVEAVARAGRQLFGIVERVPDFASIDAGDMAPRSVTLSIDDLMDDCIAQMGPAAARRGLTLRLVRAHGAPERIVADPVRLRQVLLDLLANAVRFTSEGSVELRVLASNAGGTLRIEVANTGRDLDGSAHDRLLPEFDRLDALTSIGGAEQSLAKSRHIVGLMGGAIGHVARPAGGIYWLELPLSEAVPTPREHGSAGRRSARRG